MTTRRIITFFALSNVVVVEIRLSAKPFADVNEDDFIYSLHAGLCLDLCRDSAAKVTHTHMRAHTA